LEQADAVYIGGGDTRHMMRRWRETGLDAVLKKAALSGKPIAGISAGAMCWFDKIAIKNGTDNYFIEGLGLFENFCIPHWNKHRSFAELPIAKGTSFVAIDECAAVHISERTEIVNSQPKAGAFYCRVTDKLSERKLRYGDLFRNTKKFKE